MYAHQPIRARRGARCRIASLVAVGMLAVAACGGDDDATETSDAGSGDDEASTDDTADGDDGSSGGTVTVALLRPITTLDPHGDMGADTGTQIGGKAVFDRLVASEGSEFVGQLAESWEVNEDASEWTFTIRETTFSDGTPVTADDVVTSITRIQDLEGPVAGSVADVSLEATDERTVVFTSEVGDPALLGKLTNIWIVPGEHADDPDFYADPIGSGPYLVESFTPEGTLSLTPNPTYWGGEPEVDQLDLTYIPETAARMTALRTGEVQLTWGVPDDQVPALRDEDALVVEPTPSNATYTMWINSSRDAFAEAEVRRALWQAVNFEEIIAALHPETGEMADSIIAPSVFGYAPQDPVEYDPDAAREALEAAGFDFDATYELQLRGEEFRQFAQAVASDLRDIGVQLEPTEKEAGVWLDDLLALNWDINLQSVSVPSLDAATNVGRLYPCEAERTGYCNPEVDDLLATAGSVADSEVREQAYADAIEIIWNDAVGMFPMFPRIVYAWQDGLDGVDLDPSSVPGFADLTWAGQ